jgi:flagellar basal-body rod modification protein FlgD
MTDMISPITPQLGLTPPTAAPAAPANQMGKDTFLKLLVAQLRYQDPTNPTDGTEFLTQSAQFTVVEKLEELAKSNAELLSTGMVSTAASFIGRSVTYTNSEGTEATGVVKAVKVGPMGPSLMVGNDEIQLNAVTKVSAAPAPV